MNKVKKHFVEIGISGTGYGETIFIDIAGAFFIGVDACKVAVHSESKFEDPLIDKYLLSDIYSLPFRPFHRWCDID